MARINSWVRSINLPTWITLSRLAGIPFLLVLLQFSEPQLSTIQFSPSQPAALSLRWWAVALFGLIATTDWLDGYLARRLNQVTELGKFLDPLVDKLMVMAPLLALLAEGRLPVWGVFLILAREVAIAGWRVSQPQISGANLWGKLKTVSQIAAILLLMAPLPDPGAKIGQVAFWISVILTLGSGLIYLLPTGEAEVTA